MATDVQQSPAQAAAAPGPLAARRFRWLGDRRLALLFILPAILLLLFLVVFPLLFLLGTSFTDYSAFRTLQPTTFVGFDNYVEVLTSAAVRDRFLTTMWFVVGAVGLETVAGFTIAYLISRRIRGRGMLTLVFLVPMMLAPVMVGVFWKFMLDVQLGVVNNIIAALGFARVEFLTDPDLALWTIIFVDAWQWTPFIMLIALAGLTAVPRYLYEAADIDRASEWFKFRRITLPLVWPILLIAILFRTIEAFRLFDIVAVLTGGGPGRTTEVISLSIYKVAFNNAETGLASAYGVLIIILVSIFCQFYLRYLNKVQATAS